MKKLILTVICALAIIPLSALQQATSVSAPQPSFTRKCLGYAGRAVRFGFKGMDRILGYGLMGFSLKKDYQKILLVNNTTFSKLSDGLGPDDQMPERLVQMKNELCDKMGFDHSKIHIDSRFGEVTQTDDNIGSGAAVNTGNGTGYIFVNKQFLNLPMGQQEAIMAHELAHIKYDNPYKQITVDVGSTVGAVGVGYIGSRWYKKVLDPSSFMQSGKFTQYALKAGKKTVPTVLGSALVQFFTSTYASLKYSRFKERRADIESAKVTNKAQDLINWIQETEEISNQSLVRAQKINQQNYASGRTKYEDIAIRVPDLKHPAKQDRIAYLTSYTQPQPIASERIYTDMPISC